MRLAALLGLDRDRWVCLAAGNPGEVRPLYKSPDPSSLKGISVLQYFDSDGSKDRRKVRPGEAAAATPAKKTAKSKSPS